jgi:tetratricopeptide (TPR) repeat protein
MVDSEAGAVPASDDVTATYLERILGSDETAPPRRRATDAEGEESEAAAPAPRAPTTDDRTFADFVSLLKTEPDKTDAANLSRASRARPPKRPNLKDSGVFWKTPDGFVLDPYAVTNVAQASFLPDSFQSEGVKLINAGKFREAMHFYGAQAKSEPDKADGWLGLGGALVGLDNFKDAAACFAKGHKLRPEFPVGALVAHARPGKPQLWLELARVCANLNTVSAYLCAEDIIREAMRSPMAPDNLYMEADRERRKLQAKMRLLKLKADPLHRSMSASERRARRLALTMNLGILSVLGIIALVAGVWVYHWKLGDTYFKQGLDYYYDASQMAQDMNVEDTGSAEVDELYMKAYDTFVRAAHTEPNLFDAQFMLAVSGHELLKHELHRIGPDDPLPKEYKAIQREISGAVKAMRRLDPSGERTRRKQGDLKYRPQIVSLGKLIDELEHGTRHK